VAAKKKKKLKARNPVARHAHKFNKSAPHRDRTGYQRRRRVAEPEEE